MKIIEPDGPIHSFIALPYPLPKATQDELKSLSMAVHGARSNPDKKAVTAAYAALDAFTDSARKVIGVEVVRRIYLPVGPTFA